MTKNKINRPIGAIIFWRLLIKIVRFFPPIKFKQVLVKVDMFKL